MRRQIIKRDLARLRRRSIPSLDLRLRYLEGDIQRAAEYSQRVEMPDDDAAEDRELLGIIALRHDAGIAVWLHGRDDEAGRLDIQRHRAYGIHAHACRGIAEEGIIHSDYPLTVSSD